MSDPTIDSLRKEIRGHLYDAGNLFRMNQNIRVPSPERRQTGIELDGQ